MLGLIGNSSMCGALPNPWKAWTDHIMKQKKKLGFKKAALVRGNGAHVASSAGVLVNENEIQDLSLAFMDENANNNSNALSNETPPLNRHLILPDSQPNKQPYNRSHSRVSESGSLTQDICGTVTLCGKTYIVKSRDVDQIVAFNGSKCYIITKSKTMFIIVLTESRDKREAACDWLKNVARTFRSKKF